MFGVRVRKMLQGLKDYAVLPQNKYSLSRCVITCPPSPHGRPPFSNGRRIPTQQQQHPGLETGEAGHARRAAATREWQKAAAGAPAQTSVREVLRLRLGRLLFPLLLLLLLPLFLLRVQDNNRNNNGSPSSRRRGVAPHELEVEVEVKVRMNT